MRMVSGRGDCSATVLPTMSAAYAGRARSRSMMSGTRSAEAAKSWTTASGSAPATMAIVGGETQFMFDNLTGSLGHVKDGKLRALAVTGATREPELPDVPTMTELGMKDFDKVGWMGFFVPAKTPPAVVKKLTDNLIAVLQDPAVVKRYQELGGRPGGMAPEQFSKIVERDRQDWGELIRSQKLQLD